MSEEMITGLGDQALKLISPVKEFNKLAVAKAEKLAYLQLASLQSYSELGIAQLKAALEVSDPDSLQVYVSKQSEFLKTLAEKLAEDTRAVAELSKEFSEEAQQIAKDSIATISSKAA